MEGIWRINSLGHRTIIHYLRIIAYYIHHEQSTWARALTAWKLGFLLRQPYGVGTFKKQTAFTPLLQNVLVTQIRQSLPSSEVSFPGMNPTRTLLRSHSLGRTVWLGVPPRGRTGLPSLTPAFLLLPSACPPPLRCHRILLSSGPHRTMAFQLPTNASTCLSHFRLVDFFNVTSSFLPFFSISLLGSFVLLCKHFP